MKLFLAERASPATATAVLHGPQPAACLAWQVDPRINHQPTHLLPLVATADVELLLEVQPVALPDDHVLGEADQFVDGAPVIEDEGKGLITEKTTVSSKLTLVLSAFNKCAKQTDLNIKTLSITSQNITITGDTSGRQKTTIFFNQLRESGLAVDRPNFTTKGNRDGFNITVTPKQ